MVGGAGRGRAVALVTWSIAVPVLAIGWLHRLGRVEWLRVDWTDLPDWLASTPVEDALAAMLRHVALIGAYWVAVTTGAHLVARVGRLRRVAALTSVLALPRVRRAVDHLVAGSLALSALAAPVAAAGEDVVAPVVDSEYLPPPLGQPLLPSERPEGGAEEPFETEHAEVRIRLDTTLEVVVTPGDHLWSLAERRMQERLGRPPLDHEVAPYWVAVIEANRDRLRSGDPDLIYPGEVIVLPAVDE